MTSLPLTVESPRRGKPPRHLADLDVDKRADAVREVGLPRFRADQLSRHYFGRLTDDPADMANSAAFAASLGNVERVEVLPFHQMGRFKWERLGRAYTLEDTEPPTAAAVEQACAVWRAAGLHVV